MKSSAIVRIVIYVIVIILLCGLLAIGLGISRFGLPFSIPIHFGGRDDLTAGGGSVNADLIENIEIEWASGEVILRADPESESITFAEKGSTAEKWPMGYRVKGNTLLLCFSAENTFQFGFSSSGSKTLEITVPADWVCNKLEIDSAATDATVTDLTVRKIDLDSAANQFTFENCHISILDVDGASNKLEVTGYLEELDCDGMSTKITAVLTNTPDRVDLDGMSSKLDLTLPDDCGFYVKMEGLSNHFTSDFDTQIQNNAYIYADRRCQITVDGMSSEVVIRKQK